MARERRPPSARRRGPGPRRRPDPSRRPSPEAKPRKGEGGLSRQAADEIRAAARTRAPQVIELVERAGQSLDQGRPAEAVQEASRAKALASRSSTVREVLALALYQAGMFREAIRELQAYRRITGRADQNHLLADSFRATGAPERAVPLAEEAVRAPVPLEVRAEAAVVGGAALADLGRYDEALALLRRFDREDASSQPHDLRVWYVIGDVLERAGRQAEAVERFRRIVAHDPDAYDVAERLAALS